MNGTVRNILVGLTTVLLAATGRVSADTALRFPKWFTDHMVLQRDKTIPIWGWSRPDEKVKVTLGDETQTAQAAQDGKWIVHFKSRPESGPFVLTAENGSIKTEVKDVLIGDVWVIGGQSNMNIAPEVG